MATPAGAPRTVVGLEIHVQLLTASKMFCGCAVSFGAPPNTLVCPVCLGLPGALPVLNRRAVDLGLRTALALGCRIHPRSQFHRKNYFYPDLPKNYQISQYEYAGHPPLATGGALEIVTEGARRLVRIRRVHLEEDTGRLVHAEGASGSLVDFNRSGVPLMEIVTEPDLRSPAEAREFLTALRRLLQFAEVSSGRMEEGTLRCDANVSLVGDDGVPGIRTEVKNMNSIRAVERALAYEVARQAEARRRGEAVVQETRHWDERRGVTFGSRSKEEAQDYRYFPEPDLVPLEVDEAWLERVRASLPELPAARRDRLMAAFGLGGADADRLTASPAMARFFEETVAAFPDARVVANWLVGEVAAYLNEHGTEIDAITLTPRRLADLLRLIEDGTLSGRLAKEILVAMIKDDLDAVAVVEARGLRQISDEAALGRIVEEVLAAHPGPVADVRAGKDRALGFLVGQVMKATGGRANPEAVNRLLRERVGS
ncbi:MAG: Asp-tRNA(Asn)/Glu-tRNA(Gln) amidotransferase subunit GatB [Armatimonadota bacterium]|nr:Asp-tRNA(Asn)/Glu-tRNA(Gln) amidotransferase subunit GatB [Armatimonadota bacterium]MDR7422834.1 Asp-tRNA(Asn)/Glu-tRNA(Gln) amidotransferase subunit GatB [Armatimonadota bacterium]MDR7454236.1 Asp-tRNA(Asn)/Glu-tRNA(Gln) amidotransferase subunit GatB [Armatimonadota bacterium]MDR7497167.1 Asp-tRNA(Asn)/Glu-tRNA(Gln) amidotransferase subunit GatB [Armatimonadota bacterium]MDR7512780.1 Asp-tRNA(Asn)/Glu-tRNA(Gln) amidotransferase subunit GatB [Armatimonadota bacterium]